ncbi:MAG: hypothetical protein Q4G34_08830 [Micrococcus sp.]|nr:hypothetical protein [Micrococcus sp.]MDO5634955.1 hypothetical protein [Micrococcus sp.]
MSIAPGYTDEEVRDLVMDYERQPWGTRQQWLKDKGISVHRFRRWRSAVYDGDLDRGLIPREGGLVTTSFERRRLARERAAHEAEKEQLLQRIQQLQATNDALGKAIGLLHQLNEQEPDTETNPPTSSG